MPSKSVEQASRPAQQRVEELSLEWLTREADEEILWSSSPHRSSLVPALAIGIPLSVIVVGIPIVIAAYLSYKNTHYVVTTGGLYKKTGVLSRDVQKIGFDKVQDISYNQSAIGAYFGYGNVEVSTAGGSGVEMRFRSVPTPAAVQELIDRQLTQARDTGQESKTAVLAEILTELRAIRATLEENQ